MSASSEEVHPAGLDDTPIHNRLVEDEVGLLEVEHDVQFTPPGHSVSRLDQGVMNSRIPSSFSPSWSTPTMKNKDAYRLYTTL